jgi:hypothetical protein
MAQGGGTNGLLIRTARNYSWDCAYANGFTVLTESLGVVHWWPALQVPREREFFGFWTRSGSLAQAVVRRAQLNVAFLLTPDPWSVDCAWSVEGVTWCDEGCAARRNQFIPGEVIESLSNYCLTPPALRGSG